MINIVFVSPPAAGKGTQSQMISEKYNIPHISTGSILRNEIEQQTKIGIEIKEDMSSGNLINDSIIIELLSKRLNNKDCEKGYILDGFPRTLNQAQLYDEMLEKENKQIGYIFYLNIDKESAYKRTVGRLICSKCQAVYNDMYENTKPKVSGVCDQCKGLLVKRNDDSFETFEKRFQNYLSLTKPLLEYYRRKGNLHEINSGISKEYTFTQITKVIDAGVIND